jgi:hypothetical protein
VLLFLFHSLHFRFPFRALHLASIDRILHPPPHPLAPFRCPNPPTDDAHLTPSIFDLVGPRILLTLRFGQFTRLPRSINPARDCPLRPFRDRESTQPHHLDNTTVLNLCDPAISQLHHIPAKPVSTSSPAVGVAAYSGNLITIRHHAPCLDKPPFVPLQRTTIETASTHGLAP